MDDFRDLDEDVLNLLLAAMSDICQARLLDIAKVRKAVATHKAKAEAAYVGGNTKPGQTGEEVKDVADTSIRDAQIKDSRGGLGGGSNRGFDANSARGSGSHSPMAVASEGSLESIIERNGIDIAQLMAENERMRALNRVHVPRAMWRVGACLSMRVMLTPHICRRSLRVVTCALVHRARLDMSHITDRHHHRRTVRRTATQPMSRITDHRHHRRMVGRTAHRRSFQGLAHRSTTRMGIHRTPPHQPNSRTPLRPPHLRLTTSTPSPQHRHRPESRDQYRMQARLHPLPMPFGRALALPMVVLALKGVQRYGR